jgi:hypothetical protein
MEVQAEDQDIQAATVVLTDKEQDIEVEIINHIIVAEEVVQVQEEKINMVHMNQVKVEMEYKIL